ncbi:hypothetical protein BGX27_010926 [Mortierella sp. AM989]|nr:hypothetical protein BGX27_010926 [Mortierella sp. AM989]
MTFDDTITTRSIKKPTTLHKAHKIKRLLTLSVVCCLILSLATAKPALKRNDSSKIENLSDCESIVGSDSTIPTFIDHHGIKDSAPTKCSINSKEDSSSKGIRHDSSRKTEGNLLGKRILKAKEMLQNVTGGKTHKVATCSSESIEVDVKNEEKEVKEKRLPDQDPTDSLKGDNPLPNQQTESTAETTSKLETRKEDVVETSPIEPLVTDTVEATSVDESSAELSIVETVLTEKIAPKKPIAEAASTGSAFVEPSVTEPAFIEDPSMGPHENEAVSDEAAPAEHVIPVQDTSALVQEPLTREETSTPEAFIPIANDSSPSSTTTETENHPEELTMRDDTVIYINNQVYKEVDDERHLSWQNNNHDDDDIITRYLHRNPTVPDSELDGKNGRHRGCHSSIHKSSSSNSGRSVLLPTISCFAIVLLLLLSILIVLSFRLYVHREDEASPLAFFNYLIFGIIASPFKDASTLSNATVSSFSKFNGSKNLVRADDNDMGTDMDMDTNTGMTEDSKLIAESTSYLKGSQVQSELRRTSASHHRMHDVRTTRDACHHY